MSQVPEYGAVVSSVPRLMESSLNWTPMTPMLSEAVAPIDTAVPDTVAPFEGEDIETEGEVVSGVGGGVGMEPPYSYAPMSQREPREEPSLSVENPKEAKLVPMSIAGLIT